MTLKNPNNQLLKKWRAKLENKTCIDCPKKNPDWCSVPFGVWICMDCAGTHRSLGTHISFVRSPVYDSWSDEQTLFMQIGGNSRARTLFKKHGMEGVKAQQKYSAAAALQYRKQLRIEVDRELDKLHREGRTLSGAAAPVAASVGGSATSSGSKLDEMEEAVRREVMHTHDSMRELSVGDVDDDVGDGGVGARKDRYTVIKTAPRKGKNTISVTRKLTPSSPASRGENGRSLILNGGSKHRTAEAQSIPKTSNGHDMFQGWNDNDDWDKDDVADDDMDDDWNNDWNDEDEDGDGGNRSRMKAHSNRSARVATSTSTTEHSTTNRYHGIGSRSNSSHDSDNISNSDRGATGNRYQGIGSAYAKKKNNQQGFFNADLSTLTNMNASDAAWFVTERAKDIYGRKGEYAEKALDTAQNVTRSVGKWFSDFVNEN